MKHHQKRRYYICPDAQFNESVMELLEQESSTNVERDIVCSDGKARNLIEISRDNLILIRSQKQKSGAKYLSFRQIGEGKPAKFNDASLEKTVAKATATRNAKVKTAKQLFSIPGIMRGSDIVASAQD